MDEAELLIIKTKNLFDEAHALIKIINKRIYTPEARYIKDNDKIIVIGYGRMTIRKNSAFDVPKEIPMTLFPLEYYIAYHPEYFDVFEPGFGKELKQIYDELRMKPEILYLKEMKIGLLLHPRLYFNTRFGKLIIDFMAEKHGRMSGKVKFYIGGDIDPIFSVSDIMFPDMPMNADFIIRQANEIRRSNLSSETINKIIESIDQLLAELRHIIDVYSTILLMFMALGCEVRP